MIGAPLARIGLSHLASGGGLKLAAGLGAVLLLVLALWHYRGLRIDLEQARAANQRLESNLAQAMAAADANAEAVRMIRAQSAATAASIARDRDAALARAARYETIRRETAHEADGPVAPVLRATLDGLRGGPAAAPGGDTDAGGANQPAR